MKSLGLTWNIIKAINPPRVLILMVLTFIAAGLFADSNYSSIERLMGYKHSHSAWDILLYVFGGTDPIRGFGLAQISLAILPVLLLLFVNGYYWEITSGWSKYSLPRMYSIRLWWNTHTAAMVIQSILAAFSGTAVTLIVSYLSGSPLCNPGFYANLLFPDSHLSPQETIFYSRITQACIADVIYLACLFSLRILGLLLFQAVLQFCFRKKALSLIIPLFVYAMILFLPAAAAFIPLGMTAYANVLYYGWNLLPVCIAALLPITVTYYFTGKRINKLDWL